MIEVGGEVNDEDDDLHEDDEDLINDKAVFTGGYEGMIVYEKITKSMGTV